MSTFYNNAKTVLLMGALMGLFLFVGSFWGREGMTFALLFGGVSNVFAWFFSDKIALSAMSAQPIGPDSPGVQGELYHVVDELRQAAGLPMPRVCISPQAAPNAFATGRNPHHAAVCVTQGALHLLTLDELRGVIGHELAHVKNRDTLTSCVAATISGVLAYMAQVSLFWGGGNRRGSNPLIALLAVIVAALGAVVIRAIISRSREFVADHDGAIIAGTPLGLMSALRKLETVSAQVPMNNPNPAQNNLFIVEPLTAGSVLSRLFATHPPLEKRIAALEQMLHEPMAERP